MTISTDAHDSFPGVSSDTIRQAAVLLRSARTVAFPTETVYGLGADASLAEAVARIYEVKGRPRFNPLIVHVASRAAAGAEALFTPEADRLAAAFWPGPLTLVLPRKPGGQVCDLACAGLATVAVRVPSHPVARAVIEAAARPIAAPSANRSGQISPTEAAHVREDLGDRVDLLIDGGPCAVGVESMIVACLDNRISILRPGGLATAEIEAVLGRALDPAAPAGAISAPGMLTSHYAPRAQLRLNARALAAGELGLDFSGALEAGPRGLDLSPSGDLRQAATNLYRFLRALDARAPAAIAVAPLPETGLGAAINDRLRRAAAPR